MLITKDLLIKMVFAVGVAFIIANLSTPLVMKLAKRIGAIDMPDKDRHIHEKPTPRMGGLAIFLGFVFSVLVFAEVTAEVRGILVGAIIIVVVGAIDDVVDLKAWIKFIVQTVAAVVAVLSGVVIHVLSNPLVISGEQALVIGVLAVPVTVLWIVGVTNSVNLIDGLDGLACGVSTIGALSMLVVSLLVPDGDSNVAVLLACLVGGCLGFLPYNMHPAKTFMGDTGALMLGYVMATVSVIGMFKFSAIVTFILPILALAVPLTDTVFAFTRRILKGQSPFAADRAHLHHKLLDMGFNQKQVVAVLYAASAVLGLCAVIITTTGLARTIIALVALLIAFCVGVFVHRHKHHPVPEEEKDEKA